MHQRLGLPVPGARGGPGGRILADRGRAVGTNDTFSGAGAILLPLLGGPLVEAAGLPILAIIGAGLMLIPFVMIFGLREVSPGHFVESAD